MQYGWIDFGNKERKDVEKLLECFKEKGTVDELGIGGLRDAIANKLFPGTSTLHTRSKYYFIIPTIIKHVEKSDIKINIHLDSIFLVEILNDEILNYDEVYYYNNKFYSKYNNLYDSYVIYKNIDKIISNGIKIC